MQTTTHVLLDGWLGGGRMMGMGRGFFLPSGIFALLTTIALIALLFWAFRAWSGNRQTPGLAGAGGMNLASGTTPLSTPAATAVMATTPLEVVQMRYAKGELSRAEYETMRQDLLADQLDRRPAPVASTATTEATITPETTDQAPLSPINKKDSAEPESSTE